MSSSQTPCTWAATLASQRPQTGEYGHVNNFAYLKGKWGVNYVKLEHGFGAIGVQNRSRQSQIFLVKYFFFTRSPPRRGVLSSVR